MTMLKQIDLSREGANDARPTIQRARVPSCAVGKVAEVAASVVRHGVIREVAPDAFDAVHLGNVGRLELDGEAAVLCRGVLTDELRTAGLQGIPDDQDPLPGRRPQRLQGLNHLGRTDRAGIPAEVEAREQSSCDHGQLLPAEAVLKHRGLTATSPSSRAARSLGETRFVDEDDCSALSRRDDLTPASSWVSRPESTSRRAVEHGLRAAARSGPAARAAARPRTAPLAHRSARRSAWQSAAGSTARLRTPPLRHHPSATAAARRAAPSAASLDSRNAPAGAGRRTHLSVASSPYAIPTFGTPQRDAPSRLARLQPRAADRRAADAALAPSVFARRQSPSRMQPLEAFERQAVQKALFTLASLISC